MKNNIVRYLFLGALIILAVIIFGYFQSRKVINIIVPETEIPEECRTNSIKICDANCNCTWRTGNGKG